MELRGEYMRIERRIKLDQNIYFVVVDVSYEKNENGINALLLNDYKDDYFDSGDLSLLIEQIEKEYTREKSLQYDKEIWYMADVLYIYDRIPFLSEIKEVYTGGASSISKDEIDKYIKDNDIKMTDNTDFKLYDGRTWEV